MLSKMRHMFMVLFEDFFQKVHLIYRACQTWKVHSSDINFQTCCCYKKIRYIMNFVRLKAYLTWKVQDFTAGSVKNQFKNYGCSSFVRKERALASRRADFFHNPQPTDNLHKIAALNRDFSPFLLHLASSVAHNAFHQAPSICIWKAPDSDNLPAVSMQIMRCWSFPIWSIYIMFSCLIVCLTINCLMQFKVLLRLTSLMAK